MLADSPCTTSPPPQSTISRDYQELAPRAHDAPQSTQAGLARRASNGTRAARERPRFRAIVQAELPQAHATRRHAESGNHNNGAPTDDRDRAAGLSNLSTGKVYERKASRTRLATPLVTVHPTVKSDYSQREVNNIGAILRCVAQSTFRNNCRPATCGGPIFREVAPTFADTGRAPVEIGSLSADSGPMLVEAGRAQSQIGEVRFGVPRLARVRQNLGQLRSSSGQAWPEFDDLGRTAAELGQILGWTQPTSAKIGPSSTFSFRAAL